MDGSSKSVVDIANEEVDIYKVLQMVGVDAYGLYGNNSKIYCPFGPITHMDGGQTRAMRVYLDTGSLYCFACQKYFNPVILWSEYSGLSYEESAEFLLESQGWKPETYESRWDKLTKKRKFDTSELQNALDLYCLSIHPKWKTIQVNSPYIDVFSKLMTVADNVTNVAQAEKWMEVAKQKMREVLNEDSRT